MLTSNLNATRFAQKPLYQPTYSFSNVPKAERDLKHSCLQYLESRDDFHQAMGEMLLLCKEAVRRRPDKKGPGGSKPLSLEYLADRFDIDDPLFGYLVRTQDEPPAKTRGGNSHSRWQKGMLQGFVTVTTFTNYQKTFQWNSLHPAAFSYDDDELMMDRINGERKLDEDGKLAAAMQSTVRCGDIWNEGIVWPRIAEISLLGGLGCGATLVKLVIEHLECLRPTGKANYEYVILQATDNSISFYESMGFVRVGAVVKEENVNQPESDDEDAVAEPLPKNSPEKPNAVAQTSDIITSPLTQYTTKKAGETPNDVAKRFSVDVWDIIFLNKDIYAEICPTSRMLAGTILHVPVYEKVKLPTPKKQKVKATEGPTLPQYYIAKEDDTPREIAKKFNVPCGLLVDANKGRILMSLKTISSRTRTGPFRMIPSTILNLHI
jgi:LysM repeat protein